ncbi:hypothetical protein CDAR_183241 [Caerostris darwini]|uniref:Uncharacterized protein n=1 Tax=Caerostris darwini TaxID=1538125 RepID=A0AAV4TCD6_9ARAC|nr:hypothetical protein CDAR_183241 [Caerostris darwini]
MEKVRSELEPILRTVAREITQPGCVVITSGIPPLFLCTSGDRKMANEITALASFDADIKVAHKAMIYNPKIQLALVPWLRVTSSPQVCVGAADSWREFSGGWDFGTTYNGTDTADHWQG